MVEPSDVGGWHAHRFIEYHLDLPQISDNLLFTTVDEIRNNCEVIYDAHMYKTYKAPQELNDYLAPYMTDVLKLHLADNMQVRYQVMTEQLPIHKDYDSKGVNKVLNYHITTGGDNVYTRWWDMPEDANLIFAHGAFDYHMGDHYDQSKKIYETLIPTKKWHKLTVNIPHDIGYITSPRIGLRLWNNWL